MIRSVLFLFLVSLLFACDESRRVITPVVPEGNRVILLEEFTGKGCTNCPKGSREIDNLLGIYGDNLVVISIHAGLFANPAIFNVGQYDLRTDEGEQLYQYLGPILGYPTGVVNRTEFNGDLQQISNAWAAYISQELEEEPAVTFTMQTIYNPTNRTVIVEVNGVARENVQGDLRISVALTESGIVDAQDDLEAGGIVDDYVHKHVLRDMATPFDGQNFSDGLSAGESFSRGFTMTLEEGWIDAACELVAFVSLVDQDAGTFEVLQAGAKGLAD